MNFFKKIMVMMLVIIMMCSTLSANVMAANENVKPFTDVKTTDWYKDSVNYVYSNGLMNGLSTNTFGPNDTLTRAMFVTILGRMDGVDTTQYTGSIFKDVIDGEWYSPYVKWAYENNIVKGYSNGLFGTNGSITREEMATMISRYVNAKGIDLPSSGSAVSGFRDASTVSEWAKEGLELMRRTGIIVGDSNQCFNPKNTASRAEAATVFMRLKETAYGPVFFNSCQIQLYKGKLYTLLNMDRNSGITKIPGYHDYMSYMIIYNDYIYYTESGGTGQAAVPLYRMKLDGSGLTLLIKDVYNWGGFCIYNDHLYYCNFDENSDNYIKGRVYDLKTGKVTNSEYQFHCGNSNIWISEKMNDNYSWSTYYSEPGFNNLKKLPFDNWYYGYDINEEGIVDIYKDYVYFVKNKQLMKTSIHKPGTSEKVMSFKTAKRFFICGDGLYYYENNENSSVLTRLDLINGTTKEYNLSGISYLHYGLYSYDEFNGMLYFDCYNGKQQYNISAWELNLDNGSLREIGTWFES